MKTVADLLRVLEKLPPDAKIADNHLGKLYVEDKVTQWREIFDFKERQSNETREVDVS